MNTVDKKPWRGRCSRVCWYAKGSRCRCKCGGVFHGAGRRQEKEFEQAVEVGEISESNLNAELERTYRARYWKEELRNEVSSSRL
ncbi:MAG: hypothetical protein JRD89_12555 [Deltaproteobacteria bacterium]|nr:hypothetical protein [Deltaproteobacteria bacterium]